MTKPRRETPEGSGPYYDTTKSKRMSSVGPENVHVSTLNFEKCSGENDPNLHSIVGLQRPTKPYNRDLEPLVSPQQLNSNHLTNAAVTCEIIITIILK